MKIPSPIKDNGVLKKDKHSGFKNLVINKLFSKERFLAGVLTSVFASSAVYADESKLAITPAPEVSTNDEAGVDVVSGLPQFQQTDLSIGSGVSQLSHSIASYGEYFWGFRDDFTVGVRGSETYSKVAVIGHSSQNFMRESGLYVPVRRDGATLVENTEGEFVYTRSDGTQLVTSHTAPNRVIYPNGLTVTIHRGNNTLRAYDGEPVDRLQSVTTNTGLQFKYEYETNTYSNYPHWVYPYLSPNSFDASREYGAPVGITAINNTVEYCHPIANTCTLNNEWPSTTYDWPTAQRMFAGDGYGGNAVFKVTDATGAATSYTHQRYKDLSDCEFGGPPPPFDIQGNPKYSTRVTQVSSGVSETKKLTYKTFSQINTNGGNTFSCQVRYWLIDKAEIGHAVWSYDHIQPNTSYRTTGKSIGPRGTSSVLMTSGGGAPVRLNITTPDVSIDFTENSQNLAYQSDRFGRVVEYQYDARGNIIERREKVKASSPLTDLVMTAGYPASCSNLKTCNQPTWIKDAKGYQTDYVYHAASGSVLKITGPADANGIRPQTRHTYEQKYAWFKNASGNFVKASTGVWLLTKTSSCIKGAASGNGCALANDEVITTFDYGLDSGPNNLFLRGLLVTSQGQSRRTCYTYDIYGNKISETSPKANLSSCQ